jgi:Conserved hypothetical protein 2217 (DUF2460)
MATFPKLKTNAVAQYPATRALQFRNQVMRFLDGVEQRYRDASGPLHRWTIRLEQLDEGELAAIDNFFASNQGRFGSFAFVDPWDGTAYPDCSLSSDDLDLTAVAEMKGQTSLTVVENRT